MIRKYIFIDTNIFERDHFRFDSGILQTVKHLIDNDTFIQVTNSIIQKEIERHIYEKSSQIISSYKKFKKIGLMMLNNPQYKDLNIDITQDKLAQLVIQSKNNFFINAIDIPVGNADINEIVNNYFDEIPPFNSDSKKHEFPDAIFLSALTNWTKKNNQEVVVVSQDKVVIEYCSSNKLLLPFEDLRALVQTTFKELSYTQANEVFGRLWNEISDRLVSKIDDIGVTCTQEYYAEVLSYSITHLERDREFLTQQNDNLFTISCLAQVTVNADLRYPNPTMTFYDKEDEEMYVLDYKEENVSNDFTLVYTVKIEFDQLNTSKCNLIDVSIDQPSIIDIIPSEL